MDTAEIGYLSAVELKALYAGGQLSPHEVANAVLRRIEQFDPALNAMTM